MSFVPSANPGFDWQSIWIVSNANMLKLRHNVSCTSRTSRISHIKNAGQEIERSIGKQLIDSAITPNTSFHWPAQKAA